MEFGICLLSIVPVRAEPSNKFEMTTQILFGELLTIIDKYKNWYKICLDYDNYEGWVDKIQVHKISQNEYQKLNSKEDKVTLELVQKIKNISLNKSFNIVIGSRIPPLNNSIFKLNEEEYYFNGATSGLEEQKKNKIHEYALLFLNTPYLWGGKTPFGIDCSGFTQVCYKLCGIKLMRDASQQASQGETINFISEATPGDLLFFDNEDGDIIHCGILLQENKIIHAHGKVRIDNIDHHGIFSKESQKYSHKLRIIKCVND
ncbi:MAG: C40 family peptidase [Bacteroidales bacterium]|nr:C40 family peptidase [Bacteroidales bacterium]